jgi:hypothetical protein
MKLVIQNGCRHTLTRKEFESMLAFLAPSWSKRVNSIAFYSGAEPFLRTQYFEKEKVLGLFWPKEQSDIDEKRQAIQEIIASLECISKNCDLSKSKSMMSDESASILESCLRLLKT